MLAKHYKFRFTQFVNLLHAICQHLFQFFRQNFEFFLSLFQNLSLTLSDHKGQQITIINIMQEWPYRILMVNELCILCEKLLILPQCLLSILSKFPVNSSKIWMLHVSNISFLRKLREDRSNFQEKRSEKNFPFVPYQLWVEISCENVLY